MIATSGDEAFVMFVLFPKKALILTLLIFIIGIVSGYFTDKIYVPHKILANFTENKFPLHSGEDCNSFQRDKIFSQLKRSSRYRILLMVAILLFLTGISTGLIATEAKLWIKITLLISSLFSLFVVSTVPDHFLKKHLWEHIVIKHIPRIFFWTLGTLLVFGILMQHINIEEWFSNNLYLVLLLSVLAGIIPESGPHLIFVTLFAQGIIPFSILAASSIAQDGHGMLPLLAESKYSFVAVKIVNILVAFLVGTLMLTIGAYYKMKL